MLWFKKKRSLKEEGIFEDFTDWHSHILPGVDDGIPSLDKSLEVLQEYEGLGVRKLWLTPHIMEDFPNKPEELKEKFKRLKEAWKGNVELKLASENMLDTLFEERLEKNDFLPIGDDGNHLLVETSYYTPPYNIDELMDKAISKGYFLILAHPERYRYMEEKDYRKLKDKGILFQMNLLSITGAYGETAKKKAEWLLSEDYINILGSDLHQLAATKSWIEKAIKSNQQHIDKIKRLVSEPSSI